MRYADGMLNRELAQALFDEWGRLEARIAEIRRELAGVDAGGSPAMTNGAVSKASPAPTEDSAVAPGTKSRATLEAVLALGGKAKAGPVKDVLVARKLIGDDDDAAKNVRSYFFFLKKKGYLEPEGERGVWAMTAKARSLLGSTM
jgi:hypothetical protein